jgi:hypothetical protein
MRPGRKRFDFSCRPPNNILETPIQPHARAQGSRRTAEQWDAKRRTSTRKRELEKMRRTAWAKERKRRAKAVRGPALADMGATAAAATATATTAASRKSATVPQAAVAATYCEAAVAMLPTAAAPRAAAEAATWRTCAAASKDVVATATASSAGALTSPSPPAPPAKRKQKRPQPVEPTSRHSRVEAERMGAIPQHDGDVSLGAETASLPATPPPPPPATLPPLSTMPPPHSNPL